MGSRRFPAKRPAPDDWAESGDVGLGMRPLCELARAPGLDGKTLCEAFQRTATGFSSRPALRTPGASTAITWGEYADRVRQVAGGLTDLGVRHGSTVALMLVNRPEFHILDTAAMHLGATPFSVYASASPDQIAHLLSNADSRVLVTERQFLTTLSQVAHALDHVVVLEDGLPTGHYRDFDTTWRGITSDDVATLIYTSGTSGPPKGVQLTHSNLMFALNAWARVLAMRPCGRVISYLPPAHLADRFQNHYWTMATGATITCVDAPAGVFDALLDVHPTSWFAVPRIWEKLKASLESRGIVRPSDLSEDARARVRASIGLDHADWVASGSAPITETVFSYFRALGLPIVEGWQMTETAGAGAMRTVDDVRAGTVGRMMPGIEAKLAADGELLVRGRNVMLGYRKDPEKTSEAISRDGWLLTGDVAEMDREGYLRIVDRKKELIINSAGKNMSPANIERHLRASSRLIGHACTIGDARPYNVALLVLDPDAVASFAAERGVEQSSGLNVGEDARLLRELDMAVERANSHLSRVEQIKRYMVLSSEWLPGGDELTPTMKMRRRAIATKYAREIAALYSHSVAGGSDLSCQERSDVDVRQ